MASHVDIARDIASLPLTRLRSLALEQTRAFSADDTARLIRAAPSLTALTLCDMPFPLQHLPPPDLRTLVCFSGYNPEDLPLLRSLPHLRCLRSQPAEHELADLRLLPTLTEMRFSTLADIDLLVRACNIKRLHLSGPLRCPLLPPHLPAAHFARLRVVSCKPSLTSPSRP